MGRAVPGVAVALSCCAVLLGCAPQQPPSEGSTQEPTREPTPAATVPAPAALGPFDTGSPTDHAEDLQQLADSVQRIHPEGLREDAALPTDQAEVAGLEPSALLARTMAALAGRDRDGHTGVFPNAQDDLPMWPVQLYDFEDGWRVVAADADHEHLVGRAVTGIGGAHVEDAVARVAPLVPRDNAASLRGRLPLYLVVPAVLVGVGLEPSLQLDGETVVPATVPAAEHAERFGLFSPLVCPPLPRPDEQVWEVEERDGAVVLRYRRVVFDQDGEANTSLADRLAERLEATGATRLVLDLRDNPGGELPAAAPLVEVARTFAATHPDGLRVLAGRCTFSAAALTVAELVATTDARLVGEAVGGAPEIWADPRTVTLPRTGLVAHVGRRLYEASDPTLPLELQPDVAVPVTWADHAAGVDRALQAAVED